MNIEATLYDESVDITQRVALLGQLCMSQEPEHLTMVHKMLGGVKPGKSVETTVYNKKKRELAQLIEEIMKGTQTIGTFTDLVGEKWPEIRAEVRAPNGNTSLCTLLEEDLAKNLQRGDTVLVGSGAVIGRAHQPVDGEEARLVRILDSGCVEIEVDNTQFVYQAAASLVEQIQSGEVKPGSKLLVCNKRNIAFEVIPEMKGPGHYRYLCQDPIPDVVVDRDIGSPPKYIEDVLFRARLGMENPELLDKYRISRCTSKLLAGVSGSGKTYSLHGLWNSLYDMMAEVVGVEVHELPPRVMRLRSSQLLSKWFGESEQNLDRFFDEVEILAAQPFNGHTLPLLVVLEEVDGLSRARGEEAILSRIQTTALQRLDPARPELKDKLVFFIATTNVPAQVDTAFFRRIGGSVEYFGRLKPREFVSILEKHLHRRPTNGDRDSIVKNTAEWFFGGEDRGQIKLLYTNKETETKYRRDFLTGAMIDRAVQEACFDACRNEANGGGESGLSVVALLRAFSRQVQTVTDTIRAENADSFVDIPDGVRVTAVRRVDRSPVSVESA